MSKKKNKHRDSKPGTSGPSPLRAETGPRAAGATPSRAEAGPAPATTASKGSAIHGPVPMFYEQPRPLHLTNHADLALKTPFNYGFAAKTAAVPLVLGEFMLAAKDYPIVFAPGNPPVPVAFMGLRRSENLYVERDGSWASGTYIPAYVRRYPFLLVDATAGNRKILFVDEKSSNLTRSGGTPLIADGKPTEAVQQALKFCETFAGDQQNTREFCEALVAHGLLENRDITVTLPDGAKLVLKDILVINPRKFEEVSDSVYLDWRKRKWLFPAYCHFQSGVNWPRLAERAGKTKA